MRKHYGMLDAAILDVRGETGGSELLSYFRQRLNATQNAILANAHRLVKAGKQNHRILGVGWGAYPKELDGEVVDEDMD